MQKKTHQLHAAQLNNNCPECYATNGLELIFTQEEMENKLYSRASKEIIELMHCKNCDHTIYPVNWTEDIERVYDYHKKLAIPKSTSIKLKPLAYLLIIADALLIGALIYYLK